MIGRIDLNQGFEGEGGPHTLLAPTRLRVRDFRFKADAPLERAVQLRIFKGNPDLGVVLLGCTIKPGKRTCAARGPSSPLQTGKTAAAMIDAPIRTGTLNEHDFDYSFRIVPG
jgi:hypothetical protein